MRGSDEEARFVAGTAVYRKLMAGSIPREPLLSPEEVQQRYKQMSPEERRDFDNTLGDMVVGSPETCRARIEQIAEAFGCEEIGMVTVTYQFDDRLRSYRLLSEAFGIGASRPVDEAAAILPTDLAG